MIGTIVSRANQPSPRVKRLISLGVSLLILYAASLVAVSPAHADHIKNLSDPGEIAVKELYETRAAVGDWQGDDTYHCALELAGSSDLYYYPETYESPTHWDLARRHVNAFGTYSLQSRDATGERVPTCIQGDYNGGGSRDRGGDNSGPVPLDVASYGNWWGNATGGLWQDLLGGLFWITSIENGCYGPLFELVAFDVNYPFYSWNYQEGWWDTTYRTFGSRTTLTTTEGTIEANYVVYVFEGVGHVLIWGYDPAQGEWFEGEGVAEIENRFGDITACPADSEIMHLTFTLTGSNDQLDSDVPDPTKPPGAGPVETPVGMTKEDTGRIEQPNWQRNPVFRGDTPQGGGYFGSSLSDPDAGGPYIIAKGGRVFVSSARDDRVHIYDARDASPAGSIDGTQAYSEAAALAAPLSDPRGITYYRGELYVVDAGRKRVAVFEKDDSDGTYRLRRVIGEGVLERPEGIDAAWGRLFVNEGDVVKVFEAKTGVPLGVALQPTSETCATVGCQDESQPTLAKPGKDLSTAPDASMFLAGRRANWNFDALSAPWPNTSWDLLSPFSGAEGNPAKRGLEWCVCPKIQGTDWVWGMEWLLAVTEPTAGRRAIEEFGGSRKRRQWEPKDTATGKLSDVAYNKREARVDWRGRLTESDWLKGTQSLDYAVTDADIFVVGERGEQWLELARGFQSVELRVDGNPVSLAPGSSPTTDPIGTLKLDTTQIASGTHKLALTATLVVNGQTTTLTSTNESLRIDHTPPTGTLSNPGSLIRDKVTLTATIEDPHSGPDDLKVEIDPPGTQGWAEFCPSQKQLPAYVCAWDTAKRGGDGSRLYPDGTYKIRPVRDDMLSNEAATPEITTVVDNTPPELSNPAPALGQTGNSAVVDDVVPVRLTQRDALSGVDSTTFSHNTAPNGSCDGAWREIGSASGEGDVSVAWDTRDLQSGLICLRAVSRDRAGNATPDFRWQAVLSDRRASVVSSQPGGPDRWHAGTRIGNRDGLGRLYSWGTRAIIHTPLAEETLSDEDGARGNASEIKFSASWVGNGERRGTGWVQLGLMTRRNCQINELDSSGRPKTDSDPADPWWIYGEWGHPVSDPFINGRQGYCPQAAGSSDSEYTMRTEITESASEYRGSLWWRQTGVGDWRLMYVVANDTSCNYLRQHNQPLPSECTQTDLGNYWLSKDGGLRNPSIVSEVNDPQRRMVGYFTGFKFRPTSTAKYEYPYTADQRVPLVDDDWIEGNPRLYYQVFAKDVNDPSRDRRTFCTWGPQPPIPQCNPARFWPAP